MSNVTKYMTARFHDFIMNIFDMNMSLLWGVGVLVKICIPKTNATEGEFVAK
jgi:hypothetical protein